MEFSSDGVVDGTRIGLRGERGSISPLVAIIVGLALMIAMAVGGVGEVLHRKAHAQASADAVALAVAGDGIDTGKQVAIANGVTIVSSTRLDRSGVVVHVIVVEFGGVRSTAAAALVNDGGGGWISETSPSG